MKRSPYSMYIRWSDEDQCYIAWLPEFGDYVSTHGETYEEAAEQGREVLEMIQEKIDAGEWEGPIPQPFKYGDGQTITPPDHEGKPLQSEMGKQTSSSPGNPAKEKASA